LSYLVLHIPLLLCNNSTILPLTEPRSVFEDPLRFRSSERIDRVHCSGGTVSSPKILFFTSEDLERIYHIASRKFYMVGVRSNDRIALMQPFDIYLVGFGHLEAHRRVGAEVIPLGVRLEQDFVISLMEKLQPTVIDTSPSILLRLTSVMIKKGFSLSEDFSVGKIILAGEKIEPSLRGFVEETWGAEVFNDYGLMEMGIVAAECEKHKGLHIAVDEFIVEVVDPSSGEYVGKGEIGELILTPINGRGTALIRYRSGDLVRMKESKCPCGRTHPLIDLVGRKDETLMVEGINLYPYQFDQALQEFVPEVVNYQIIYENVGEEDRLRLICEAKLSVDRNKLKSKIFNALRYVSIDFLEIIEKSSVKVDIEIAEPLVISSTARGKTKKFIDRRSAAIEF
jgi:phenylacetate-CoA ligase